VSLHKLSFTIADHKIYAHGLFLWNKTSIYCDHLTHYPTALNNKSILLSDVFYLPVVQFKLQLRTRKQIECNIISN